MEFLKAILGEELYNQVASRITAFNQLPENAKKQVKLANLGEGGYVNKEKYAALEATHNSKLAELTQANTLITDLQKSVANNAEVQAKFNDYNAQIQKLQEDNEKIKVESALGIALLESGAEDIDYLRYKLNQNLNGSKWEIDENGKVKGINEKIDALKIQYPNQFSANAKKVIDVNKLPKGTDKDITPTKEDFRKMSYEDRVKLKQDNPDLYKNLSKKE